MTQEEIDAVLALSPQEAAAIIKKKFRSKQTFETNPRGDQYFFLVDPTITIPSHVAQFMDENVAFSTAEDDIKDHVAKFARALVVSNEWGVVGYKEPSRTGHFLHLNVEPGYLERGGRIRRGVDPRVIPGLLVTLMTVKERLDASVHRLVTQIGTTRWWHDNGYLNEPRKKQDWSPREWFPGED